MRFLVDAQLPSALARHLASLGHDAQHVSELGLQSGSDREIWQRDASMGAILVTKDEDFVTLRALAQSGPTVLWVRIGNTSSDALLAHISSKWRTLLAALERGETVIEIA